MKYLLSISIVGLALALATPVAAQPVEIIVRGGALEVLPDPLPSGDDYVYGRSIFDNPNFDPGVAAINAMNVTMNRSRRAIDVDLVLALARTPGSWTEHQEACQAAFASYDMATDTILAGGLPRRCPL